MSGQLPEPRPDVGDPGRLRISDEDRHRVAEVLREAAGDGRIDLDELDERLEATYQAKTYADLVPITVDLPTAGRSAVPVPRPRSSAPVPAGAHYATSLAVMSEVRRTGAWRIEDGHTAFALMGTVVLDLREAQLAERDLTVNANAVMGEVRIIVNAGTTVVVAGAGVMGEFSEQRPKVAFDAEAGGPVVRVRGLALMGSVHVQRRGAPGAGPLGRLGRR